MLRWIVPVGVLLAVLVAGMREPSLGRDDAKVKKPMLKAVVHVNFGDPERQGHGLKNVENILKAVEGDAEIEVVAHGPGITLLLRGDSRHSETIQSLIRRKVKFAACKNTLRDKSISEDRLLPGVQVVPSGAVEVLRKQQEGFGYFRP